MPVAALAAALALAGCGGSDKPAADTGGGSCTFGKKADGECYTEAEYRAKVKADAEKKAEDERKAKEMAEATTKRAKDLLAILADGTYPATAVVTRPASSSDSEPFHSSTDLGKAFAAAQKADDGMGTEKKAQVAVMDTKGAMVETANAPGGVTISSGVISSGFASANAKYVAGGDFATGNAKKTHKVKDKVTGTYAGTAGKYVCGERSICTSQRGNGGVILTGDWSFESDLREPKFKGDDTDYAEFGWWLDESITGAQKAGAWYDFGSSGGPAPNIATKVTSASDSATYTGHANGQAAFYHRLGEEANIGGAFTADATLTADFDANSGGGTLKGEITGFNVGGVDVPEWSVELMEQNIAGGGVAAVNKGTKWTLDGTAADAAGTWSASFYDIPEDEHQPKGVAGGFVSHYGADGRMVGAFGGER